MARVRQSALLDPIRRLVGDGAAAPMDGELLERYVATADAASFELLVWRHGPMILSLCQRVVRDAHEAEDAFQATFLVFARKAKSIGRQEAVGAWLYKVAYRIALRLRGAARKRPLITGATADDRPAREPAAYADWSDLRPVLDEEIARLPEKHRAAVVLCDLEGRTNEEAARQLGCPKGTILSRLSRGRERLRNRLIRRGVTPSVSAMFLACSQATNAAVVSTALAREIVNAALPFAAGKAAEALVTPAVAALTHGALRSMFLTKVKLATMSLLALSLVATGGSWAARGNGPGGSYPSGDVPAELAGPISTHPSATAQPPEPENVAAENEPADQPERARGEPTPGLAGKVIAVAQGGMAFTIEMLPRARGEEPTKEEIKLTPKTSITYNGVELEGAKLTVGYSAQVQVEKGTTVATAVSFTGTASDRRGPDLTGEVVEVAKDGKGITIEQRGSRGRGAEPKRETVPFDDKTVISFSNVAAGQAKMSAGYQVGVYLADDGKTAGQVQFIGNAVERERGRRDAPRPDIGGIGRAVLVETVRADAKSLTLRIPPAGRGEAGTEQVIKIGEKTAVSYDNVGIDGAKPTVGYSVQVWLADGSKDRADRVLLIGVVPDRWAFVTGKVDEIISMDRDGFTITVGMPPVGRDEVPAPPRIKVPASAKVSFFRVGAGEAKPTVGFDVQIQLREGSTDTASQVRFSKSSPRSEGGRR